MTTVREAFYEVARKLGLTTIFGNPGSTEETLLKDFPPDFRYVLALQEAPAVAMADGYAQRTGRAALVNLHTAAGMGNAMGNIESAWYNRAPLIITAGQQTRQMLLLEPYLTNTQPTDLPKPFVKWAYEPSRPEDVPGALMRAYAMAVQPPAGPVFLSIPMDDLDKPARVPEIRLVSRRLGADPRYLANVVDALNAAKSPVLIIGGAVDQSDGWDDGVRLAERLRCKVWAAPGEGRPGFPETHAAFQGSLPGAIRPLCDLLGGHDVIVVIGAPVFRYYPYVEGNYIPHGSRLFHITDDPNEAGRAPVGESILADPARACAVLADLIKEPQRPAPAPRPRLAAPSDHQCITPERLYFAIDQARPDDSVIVQESMSSLKALRQRLPTSRARSFFSMSSGVLGYGLPAAIGVALAERDEGTDRKVIDIVGDGAANYVIQALWTAVQHTLDILFVIPRNGAYNILKAFANQLHTPGVPGLDLPGLDFLSLAAGYGCQAERVTELSTLDTALQRGIATPGPHLIEVHVDPTVPSLL
ncbi:thiamine pyrophosphate binding domain-containing protein [Acetobacter nitrogenifigens DSM 23921 = NBRC 105050]|uniref:Benzoylformate decarboxylase n=1 Tax=Acetobacter nitrogenifigens DSM 23921 = NBRC 105050 TaxID=1120919 RepID=A0A511XAH5_9PROT|nr:benzoylformate decarboxylase [Acetobacter nitrogenifigens]GBQ91352.1 thiamine pyrophosphate binding domain-containing protein [Acetobacter nitrogenifigens DSM 23921 = NBRC 105050]GEN59911.1 benzoylformate decarboxylase [Acetobacter nitrogenifigens DSM 23921 = NBRC 105050]